MSRSLGADLLASLAGSGWLPGLQNSSPSFFNSRARPECSSPGKGLTPSRLEVVIGQNGCHQKNTNDKCWQGRGEKRTFAHCWWECKLVKPWWKTVWGFLKKLKIELPHDPASPLLSIYLKKTKTLIRKETRTPMQHYLQLSRYGSNLSVHQQMNG